MAPYKTVVSAFICACACACQTPGSVLRDFRRTQQQTACCRVLDIIVSVYRRWRARELGVHYRLHKVKCAMCTSRTLHVMDWIVRARDARQSEYTSDSNGQTRRRLATTTRSKPEARLSSDRACVCVSVENKHRVPHTSTCIKHVVRMEHWESLCLAPTPSCSMRKTHASTSSPTHVMMVLAQFVHTLYAPEHSKTSVQSGHIINLRPAH